MEIITAKRTEKIIEILMSEFVTFSAKIIYFKPRRIE